MRAASTCEHMCQRLFSRDGALCFASDKGATRRGLLSFLGKTRFQRRPVLPRWWYEYIALRFIPAWIPNNRMAQVADAQNAREQLA